MDYWQEVLECALDEAGCYNALTAEQIAAVARDMKFAAEMESEATGRCHIPNPLEQELKATKQALRDEKDKVVCKVCGGKGRIITLGPYHSSDSECCKCHGEGRHKP